LHRHLHFRVFGAEVHHRFLEVFLFDLGLIEGFIGHLGLLDHHHDHHFHGILLAAHFGLLFHVLLLLGHVFHLVLGGLLQPLDVLHGLELVNFGRFFAAAGLGFLELTLLGHHDELLSLGVLHELAVSHLELLLVDSEEFNHLLEEIVGGVFFFHEHFSHDFCILIHVVGLQGDSAGINLNLARAFILLLDSSDNELKELEEVLSVDQGAVLLHFQKLLGLQHFHEVIFIKLMFITFLIFIRV